MRLTRLLAALRRPAACPRPTCRLGVESLEARENPSTGGLLDPTFGSGGYVMSSFAGLSNAQALAVATQPDGKIVAVGSSLSSRSNTSDDFLVARYKADGTLDTGFGSGGYVTTDFNRYSDLGRAVALQPDGKIVVSGYACKAAPKGGSTTTMDWALARYNPNGTLDTTFGTKGKVVTDLGASSETITSVFVDGSGRILVGGNTVNAAGQSVVALARYNPNGTLDTSFGSGGKMVSAVRQNGYMPDQMALQADKIVVAGSLAYSVAPGTSSSDFVVARFNADGTPDTSFGSGGTVSTHVGVYDNFGGLTVDPSGRIVVAGWDSNAAATPRGYYLLRYIADGTLDGNFGSGGVVTLARTDGSWSVNAGQDVVGVAVQADGQIVLGGKMYDNIGQQEAFVATRVDSAGKQDTGYGIGGWADAQFATNDAPWGMTLQPDGRLLLAGRAATIPGGPTSLALVRFLPSAPQVGSVGAVQNADGTTTLTGSGITDGNPGATVTKVEFFYFDASGTKQSLGFGTRSADGSWSRTVVLPPGTGTLYAQATDSYGAVGDPVSLTLQVA